MKKFAKKSALILSATLLLGSLAACGGKSETTTTTAATTQAAETTTEAETEAATETPAEAKTETAGEFSVDVPGGFEFSIGDVFDENDTRYFSVKSSSFKYFDFKADGEELIKKNYDYNKKTYTNEQEDVKANYGGTDWTGFQYSDGFGGYGFEAYATIDGAMIRVSSAGYKFDTDEAKAILGSVKHTGAAAAKDTTEEAKSEEKSEETTEETTTEEVTTEAAPVYVKTFDMKVGKVNIPEGYEELKDAAPSQYVMTNSETGGKVSYTCMSGTGEDAVTKIMSGLDYEDKTYENNGMTWVGGVSDGFYCFATTVDDTYLAISIDFGGTMEEMETLIKAVEF